MALFRIRIDNLPPARIGSNGEWNFLTIGSNDHGLTLRWLPAGEFPTVFDSRHRRQGKQIRAVRQIKQDPTDARFLLCEVNEFWLPLPPAEARALS